MASARQSHRRAPDLLDGRLGELLNVMHSQVDMRGTSVANTD
ncbi:hypothetical protein [Sphingomonas sp.]